jgi:hypothetical protein
MDEQVQKTQDDCSKDNGSKEFNEEDSAGRQLEDNYDREKVRRLLMYILLIPATVSLCLWLLGTWDSNEFLPTSLDVHLWHNFSSHVKQSVQALDSKYPHNVLLVLLGIHAVQVLFCLLMHVTKIMYGYFFGTLQGGDIRCVWELFLIGLFVLELLHLPLHRVPALLPAVCALDRHAKPRS